MDFMLNTRTSHQSFVQKLYEAHTCTNIGARHLTGDARNKIAARGEAQLSPQLCAFKPNDSHGIRAEWVFSSAGAT